MRRFLLRQWSFMPFLVKDHPAWVDYGLAVVFSALAMWTSEAFWSYSGEGKTHTMLPLAAVFLGTVAGGFLPGVLSLLMSTLSIIYLLEPVGSFHVASATDKVWLTIYVILACGAIYLAVALRSAIRRGHQTSLRLESEVKNRTLELTRTNSELRRLVSEIEESSRFSDFLLENIPLPIYLKRIDDRRIVRVNKVAREAIVGKTEYVGKTAYELFSRDMADRLEQADQKAVATRSVVESEETYPHPQLGSRIFAVKKVPLFDSSGRPAYILGIAEDITEKKRSEEQRLNLIYEQARRAEAERRKNELEDAVRARDTFLSICSHELKTPLTSLKLQAGIIRMFFENNDENALRSPKIRELVMDADKEINRINRLINDMLDVSRIRSGKLSLHPERVNLGEVINEVVSHFKADPAYHDVEIEMDVSDEITGTWDQNRLEQIVINLLSNALKYGDRKPIRVSALVHGNIARFSVEDQGMGISTEDQRKIFQRFERAGASESISGLGLGLYIVKEIVTMHGGNIWVESEMHQGSKFIVELPLIANVRAGAA